MLITNKVVVTNVDEERFSKGVALVKISSRGQTRSFRKIPEPSLYILDLRSVSLSEIIDLLKSMIIFNPKALFYLIISEIGDIQVSSLMRNYIHKVVLVTVKGHTYTFFPYNSTNVGQLELLKNISQCHTSQLETIPPPLKYLRSFKLNVVLKINSPYVTGNGNGFEESMIKYIQTWLKINVSFSYREMGVMLYSIFFSLKSFDFQVVTVPYTEIKRALKNNTIDLFGGHILTTHTDVRNFELTPTYFFDSLRFISPKSESISRWERLFNACSPIVWILLLVSSVLSAIIAKLFYNIGFVDNLFAYIAVFVGSPLKYFSTNVLSQKILFAMWILCFMILSKLFSNFLIVLSATTLKSTKFINTFDDVIKSGLPVYSFVNLSHLYTDSIELEKMKSLDMRKCKSYVDCIPHVISKQNCITLCGTGIAKFYYLPLNYLQKGEVMFHISKEKIHSLPLMLFFAKGHPLYEPFCRLFHLSLSNGWLFNNGKTVRETEKRYMKFELVSKKMALKDLADVFALWVIGVHLSSMVFVFEVICYVVRRCFLKREQYI